MTDTATSEAYWPVVWSAPFSRVAIPRRGIHVAKAHGRGVRSVVRPINGADVGQANVGQFLAYDGLDQGNGGRAIVGAKGWGWHRRCGFDFTPDDVDDVIRAIGRRQTAEVFAGGRSSRVGEAGKWVGNATALGLFKSPAFGKDGLYSRTILKHKEVKGIICYALNDMCHFISFGHPRIHLAAQSEHILNVCEVGLGARLDTRSEVFLSGALTSNRPAKQIRELLFTNVPGGKFLFVGLKPDACRSREIEYQISQHGGLVPVVALAHPLIKLKPIFNIRVVSAGKGAGVARLCQNDGWRGGRRARSILALSWHGRCSQGAPAA